MCNPIYAIGNLILDTVYWVFPSADKRTYVHTIGDSILDNIFWVSQDKYSVEGQLRANGHNVISHAYDGFTTHSVLGEDSIGAVLPSSPKKRAYMRKKATNGVLVSPLKELQKKISERPNASHYVVISVGGNDFRVNLHDPLRLVRDIPQIQNRYLQIIEKIKNLKGRNVHPILVSQYRTDANNDPYKIYTVLGALGSVAVATHLVCFSFLSAPAWYLAGQVSSFTASLITSVGGVGLYGSTKIVPSAVTKDVVFSRKKISMSMYGRMLESFYQPMLKRAQEEGIAVLDLANTFDPHGNLYESGIEPNENGGKLIADGIDHIVRNHDFSGESALYSKRNGNSEFVGVNNRNSSAWRVAYPSRSK
ncbi:MAG: hypothetical protein K940chlam6_00390 [Chlamydiae bacterium]|nr:hypothetical protein [Chlamydiota bacterium]